jgi:hypothetical protein
MSELDFAMVRRLQYSSKVTELEGYTCEAILRECGWREIGDIVYCKCFRKCLAQIPCRVLESHIPTRWR